MSVLRSAILAVSLLAAVGSAGCASNGFVQLADPAPPSAEVQNVVLYARTDISRPYKVLGYVYRTSVGHREGLVPEANGVYVLQPDSDEVLEFKRLAAAKGADAVVGVELFPAYSLFGQMVGVSIGGLAVKFVQPQVHPSASAVVSPPAPASTEQAPVVSSSPTNASSSDSTTPASPRSATPQPTENGAPTQPQEPSGK